LLINGHDVWVSKGLGRPHLVSTCASERQHPPVRIRCPNPRDRNTNLSLLANLRSFVSAANNAPGCWLQLQVSLRRPKSKANNLFPPSAEIKNAWSYLPVFYTPVLHKTVTLYLILSLQNTPVQCIQNFPNSAQVHVENQTFWKLPVLDMQWLWCDWVTEWLTQTPLATVTGFPLLQFFDRPHAYFRRYVRAWSVSDDTWLAFMVTTQ
jgi:hypothetical protein